MSMSIISTLLFSLSVGQHVELGSCLQLFSNLSDYNVIKLILITL